MAVKIVIIQLGTWCTFLRRNFNLKTFEFPCSLRFAVGMVSMTYELNQNKFLNLPAFDFFADLVVNRLL